MAKGSERRFQDKQRGKVRRKRKPVVLLVAEEDDLHVAGHRGDFVRNEILVEVRRVLHRGVAVLEAEQSGEGD